MASSRYHSIIGGAEGHLNDSDLEQDICYIELESLTVGLYSEPPVHLYLYHSKSRGPKKERWNSCQ